MLTFLLDPCCPNLRNSVLSLPVHTYSYCLLNETIAWLFILFILLLADGFGVVAMVREAKINK